MQQTKRRSKKGVILLALTIALLVLAFAPSAMAAPASLTINNGATIIGDTQVTLQFNGDTAWPVTVVRYEIQDAYSGPPEPGVFKPATPASVLYVNGTPVEIDYLMHSTATPVVGQNFTVRVRFYDASSLIWFDVTANVVFDNTKTVSFVDWNAYGVAGDYSTTWLVPTVRSPRSKPTSTRPALRLTRSSGRSIAALGTTFWPRGRTQSSSGVLSPTASTRSRTTVSAPLL